jgi:hypothetical protein
MNEVPMSKVEIRGMIKGIGITLIFSAAIFYGLVLNLRHEMKNDSYTSEEIVNEARDLGMIYITEVNEVDFLSKEYIIKLAKSYGMEFIEEASGE